MKYITAIAQKWAHMSLVLRIFIGLVVGLVLGLILPSATPIALLGELFVGALKAIAPLLVAVLVASSVAKAGSGLGSRFRKVIVLYLLSSLLAATVAVIASDLFPVTLSLGGEALEAEAPGSLGDVFSNLLSRMVANPISSIVEANYIGILFWSIIIGLALKRLALDHTIKVVHDFADVISLVVKWVIQFAPFGILGIVFNSVSKSGLDVFATYGQLIALLVGCMLFNSLVVSPLIGFSFTRRNPYPLLFTCLKGSGISAFFTRSSAANIPVNMNLCKRLGLDEEFYSVSIPLGATVNMNGAAVTISVMALAVAHTMGIEVSLFTAVFLCIVSTLGACGASGVAGGSLLLVPMACSLFGVSNDIAMQAVAIGFVIGVIQDSMETAINSSSDVFFTAIAENVEH